MRARQIWCALSYGIRPWWMYEDECHYEGMSYGEHLRINLALAWRWATGRQTDDDVRFARGED